MSTFLAVLIAFVAIVALWRFLTSHFRTGQPANPVDAEPIDDPFAPVPAPRKNLPKARSGAAAVEEPDDAVTADCFPARALS